MSFGNIVLAHEPIRQTLLELDKFAGETPYKTATVGYFIRKACGLDENEPIPEQITALTKAEFQKGFPGSPEQEIDAFLKARFNRVETLCVQLKADTEDIISEFINEAVIQKAREQFTEKLGSLLSDDNLDVFLDYKISQLEPSLSKAIMESTRKEGKN